MRRRLALATFLLLASCSGETLTHVPAPGTHTEVFNQNSVSKIDLLWIVDNSGSMADKQAKLAASFQSFIDEFTRGAIDYRIAVTSTDTNTHAPGAAGTFFGSPAIIRPTDDDPLAEFQQNVKVGVLGSGNEEGLSAAKLALDSVSQTNAPIIQARTACISGCSASPAQSASCVEACENKNEPDFLRPDAHLYIVMVSDDEDHSASEPIYYARYFETVKGLGNAFAVSVSAIGGDLPSPPCDARPATRYAAVAQLTGGIFGSICDATFNQNLTRLAADSVGLKRHFLLGSYPDLTTLALQVSFPCSTPHGDLAACASVSDQCNGALDGRLGLVCTPQPSQEVAVDALHPEGYTAGWTYSCADNSLTFHRDASADAVPGLGAQLQVTYLPSKVAQCGS